MRHVFRTNVGMKQLDGTDILDGFIYDTNLDIGNENINSKQKYGISE